MDEQNEMPNAETPEPELTPIPDLPLPEVYYDGRQFYIPNSSGGWVPVNTSSVWQFLIGSGFSARRAKDELQSQVDVMILRIQREHDVSYIGPLAGYPAGLYTMNNDKILVTSSPKFIQPKPGAFDLLRQLLTNLLGERQLIYFYAWLKLALDMFRTRICQPGQVVALCGPVGAGKTLLRLIITALLGGRVAFPHLFMTGRTTFSSDLFGAETLAIEDQQESVDIRARRHFGAAIKDLAVNKDQRCERKHCDPLTLVPLRRVIVTLNDDPERIQVLPPLDDDIADKIMLFKIDKHPMPMPTRTASEKEAFWRALENEFPMFVQFLDKWEIPEEIQCERYGVTHFHHPNLVALLRATSPEGHLLELINDFIFEGSDEKEYWEATADSVEAELCAEESPCRVKARKLLPHPNSCGTYLGRLERQYPDVVSRRMKWGRTIWRINNPRWIVKQKAAQQEAAANLGDLGDNERGVTDGQIQTANSRNEIGAATSDEQGAEGNRSRRTRLTSVEDSLPPIIVRQRESLEDIAQAVRKADKVGFDLETYGQTLDPWRGEIGVLSLALPNSPPWLLDLKAIGYDLGPLGPALESVELIGHHAKFDALWLRVNCRLTFTKLYCTCTASRLLTAGSRAENSLGACLAAHLNVSLSKTEGRSDWGSMLLTPEQLAYCSNDVAYLHDLRKALDQKLRAAGLEKVAELEMALLPVVTNIEATGFAVDRGRLTALRDKAREETAGADTELRNILGQSINPASPKQLLTALHARGIRLKNTDEHSLADCKDTTVVPIIRRFRASEKRRQGTQKLLDAIESDGRIHGQFNPTGTDTGRFSCTQPNLQAIERGEMRECFTAGEGNSLIVADYSQIELRVAAAIAPEPAMIAAYEAGADLHVQTARIILKKSTEEAVSSEERQLAKAINFGLLYGQSAKGLVRYLKSGFHISKSEAEAKQFVARFFGAYSGLKAWQEKCQRLANNYATGEIRSALGRRRLLPSGKDKFWERYTCALNMPIQGGCGDGLKRAMLRLSKILPTHSQIISTDHDELIVEAPVEEADAVKAIVEREMVEAMAKLYPTVPIEVEAKVCQTWGKK